MVNVVATVVKGFRAVAMEVVARGTDVGCGIFGFGLVAGGVCCCGADSHGEWAARG